MSRLNANEKALLRRAIEEETRSLVKDGQNTSNEYRSEYPRMMYRKTDQAIEQVVSTDRNGLPREIATINNFGGRDKKDWLLCDTIVADDIDHAEALAADGWDITPQAAHGVVTGLAAQTSAKDDEIAALRAELAAMRDTPRRGRPPRQPEELGSVE